MAAAPLFMSVDEYLRTPETLVPQELAFGALRVSEAPHPRHQQAVFAIARALDAYVSAYALGQVWISPLDVILDEQRALIVQPDLFFICSARGFIVRDRVRGAPDLVVEVLSPHPRIGEFRERLGWFAQYGVRECWAYRQMERRRAVPALTPGGVPPPLTLDRREPIRSAVLPGFSRSLDEILT